jgi:hypothetical protein
LSDMVLTLIIISSKVIGYDYECHVFRQNI